MRRRNVLLLIAAGLFLLVIFTYWGGSLKETPPDGGPGPPAPAPPAEAPIPRRLDLSGSIEQELRKLSPGQILFNPPQQMQVGIEERIEVRIARGITKDLSKGLKGSGLPELDKIKVGPLMKVLLEGNNFDIKKLSEEEQILPLEGFTQWSWDVIPLRSGIQFLHLIVTVKITLPNGVEKSYSYPVYDREIKVKVNRIYTVKGFLINYWQWIITAIIIPIIGWAIKRWRDSKKKSHRKKKTN